MSTMLVVAKVACTADTVRTIPSTNTRRTLTSLTVVVRGCPP